MSVAKNIGDFGKTFRTKAEKAVLKGALQLLGDAQNEYPRPPIDTSTLRGSQFAMVATHEIGNPPSEFIGLNKQLNTDKVSGIVGFAAEYASIMHDQLYPAEAGSGKRQFYPSEKSEKAQGGGLFLSSKMIKYAEKYKATIAEALKL